MATVVKHIETGKKFILLGTGFGAFESKKPNWFFGDLVADTNEGQFAMVCVSDWRGEIGWIESSKVIVDSVDGQQVRSLIED